MEIRRACQKTKILPSYPQRQTATPGEPNRIAYLFKVYEQTDHQYLSILGIVPFSNPPQYFCFSLYAICYTKFRSHHTNHLLLSLLLYYHSIIPYRLLTHLTPSLACPIHNREPPPHTQHHPNTSCQQISGILPCTFPTQFSS